MSTCLICDSEKNYPICGNCKKSAYNVETCRQILSQNGDLDALKVMYDSSWAEIIDLNSSTFWNNKLEEIVNISCQDGMTKDRIYTALSYVKKGTKKILDVGAGYGFFEEVALQKGYKYEIYGFDISSRAINNLRKRFAGEFSVKSFYDFSYHNTKFDAIIALEVLEHIPPSKTLDILSKFKKNLSPNGQLIISVPINEGLRNKKDNPSGHVREYTYPLIKSELILSGFNILQHKQLYAFKNLYKFKCLMQKYIFPHKWKPNDLVINAVKS